MCLYQTSIKNPRYLINEKNRGKVPTPETEKELYIQTSCGWCIECRKKIAAEWRIRLMEEYKAHREAEFINLSFSPENIKKLEEDLKKAKWRGIEGNEIDVNLLASYAIRMYMERLRKKYKIGIRHWFITELGKKNSERIHLHGIMWKPENTDKEEFKKDIEQKWLYGNVYIGEYVNEKTINYIIKYITKVDDLHKGYKQRVITSKGIGKEYVYTRGKILNSFKGENTNTKYKTQTGINIELPRYYKDKLYTEEQRQELYKNSIQRGEIFIKGVKFKLEEQDDLEYRNNFINCLKTARKDNKGMGYGNNEWTNIKYIITEAMKVEYKNILELQKTEQIKKTERRNLSEIIKYIEEYKNTKDLTKEIEVDKYIYSTYKGTTTEAQRSYNKLIEEAAELHLTVRQLRLKKKGLPY